MKRIAITLLTALLLSPSTALGQTRGRSTRPRPQPATTATQRVSQVRTQGAQEVAEQIKHLSRYTYTLGKIVIGITTEDESIRRKEAPPAVVQNNQQTKAAIRSTITGFREGLDRIEIKFRTTPELQPFYIKLAGSAAGAAAAEEQAAAGQFDAAGKTLLNVINRLADVLVIMRQ